MSYQVFARKYRPRTFADVLGQEHVVRTLRNAIAQNRLAHAYLFVGPRGTGKTSTARIFAKALNCPGGPMVDFDPDDPLCVEIEKGIALDVREIDGASNNGVEQVRELREEVKFAPTRCRFKIYYIDEVHMLSTAAFNALLKTLEEPPEHVKFIFATTEAHKVLPTIISRCQRFDLRRIPASVIAKHLLHIASLEGITLEEKAAYTIAKGAEGGMRDAQSMLDQLVAFCGGHIVEQDVLDIFGFTQGETVARLAQQILYRDTVGALQELHSQADGGKDLSRLLADLIQYLRTLLVHQVDAPAAEEDLSPELITMVREQAAMVEASSLLRVMDGLAEVDARMRWASNKLLHLEIGLIQAVQTLGEVTLTEVLQVLGGGEAPARRAPVPVRPALPPVIQAPAAAVPRPVAPPPEPVAVVPAPSPAPVPVPVRESAPTPEPTLQRVEPETTPALAPAPEAAERQPVAPPVVGVKAVAKEEAPPAPAPEPAPVSSPQPIVASSEALDFGLELEVGETPNEGDLWTSLLTRIQAERPLVTGWIDYGVLLGRSGKQVRIGLPATESAARDSLLRPGTRQFIEGILAELTGQPSQLEVVLDDSLAPPPATEMSFNFGDLGSPAPSKPEAVAPPVKAPEPVAAVPASVEPVTESKPELAPEFYNDPLIKAALEKFKATLVR